ncbi:MAG: response regulator [Deltaproteobacteria bacterium]|nr:MAG: response regulator [Deltaproteobacteria bacterium]
MKARILIVDDEAAIRDSLARHFRLKGYETATAENGLSALEKLSDLSFQVVVSDIMMPVMDGIDLLRRIRTEYPMTRVVMITGYVTLENALACLRNNADTCVFKPLDDLQELDTAVENAVAYLEHWKRKLVVLKGMKPTGG